MKFENERNEYLFRMLSWILFNAARPVVTDALLLYWALNQSLGCKVAIAIWGITGLPMLIGIGYRTFAVSVCKLGLAFYVYMILNEKTFALWFPVLLICIEGVFYIIQTTVMLMNDNYANELRNEDCFIKRIPLWLYVFILFPYYFIGPKSGILLTIAIITVWGMYLSKK